VTISLRCTKNGQFLFSILSINIQEVIKFGRLSFDICKSNYVFLYQSKGGRISVNFKLKSGILLKLQFKKDLSTLTSPKLDLVRIEEDKEDIALSVLIKTNIEYRHISLTIKSHICCKVPPIKHKKL